MIAARYHLLIVCILWFGIISATALMYFLRVLDEMGFINGFSNARWWHLGPFVLVLCLIFWLALAALILSLIMVFKPFFASNVDAETQIYLAVPGIVLFCGNTLLLFHIGRKLVAAVASRRNAKISFFFERGVLLSEEPLTQDSDGDIEMEIPYVRAGNEFLY